MSAQAPHSRRAFGRYQVVEPLGSGAMGEVYLGRDDVLHREVAIKTVRPGLGGAFRDELHRRRFLNEARAVAGLAHANIVQVFDMGFEDEAPFLVMEVVRGRSLRERLQGEGTLPPNEARALGIQMARALLAAHERGVLHRDVKPANILEAEPGLWKLTDFGVARLPTSDLTIEGQFVGTPSYAAPESLADGAFSPASDVYGLGATLYEAITGEPPYGRKGLGTLSPERTVTPPSARRRDVPADLDALVLRALARDPAARPSAAELADHLARASLPAPAPAVPAAAPAPDRRKWVALGLALAVLVGIAIGAGLGSDKPARPEPKPSPLLREEGRGGGPPPPPDPHRQRKAEEHWRKATDKLREGKLHDAEKELEKVLKETPDDREAEELLERVREQERAWENEDWSDEEDWPDDYYD